MSQQPGRREAVHAWHANVHQDDVGRPAMGEGDGLDTVRRLPYDLEVRLGLQDRP